MKLTRRSFFAILFTLTLATSSNAETQQLGPNYFSSGVPSNQFAYFAAASSSGRQRQRNWCWAACIQMVLNYHGLYVDQGNIVTRVFGRQVDSPANLRNILNALSGWAPDTRGRFSQVIATTYNPRDASIVNDLHFRWPIIVGLSNPGMEIGHAYVLTGIYYSVDQHKRYWFHKAVLRDPWPGNPSRQEISWSAFNQRFLFGAKVYVNRL